MTGPDATDYPRWRDAFADVLDTRLFPLWWLDSKVDGGQALMWSDDDAAIIAEVRIYPTGASDIHGLVAAGDLDAIAHRLIPQAEGWAKAAGCIGAVIESREGWGRVLKGAGYRPYQIAVRKDF